MRLRMAKKIAKKEHEQGRKSIRRITLYRARNRYGKWYRRYT